MKPSLRPLPLRALVAVFGLACAPLAGAQQPSPAPAPAAAPVSVGVTMSDFAWLAGCWRGTVNRREFREQWMPLRGNVIIGAGHTVLEERTQSYEYIRIEPRDDGIHYVVLPSGGKETAFRLADRQIDGNDTIFTFANPSSEFPQRIVYRRGSEGWLYVHVEGRVQGEERRVIYPMRRIGCESGEPIPK